MTAPQTTCLQPCDLRQYLLDNEDDILCLAPGENNKPTKVMDTERQCFPTLFPRATNAFQEPRNVPISFNRYINCRLQSVDNRFASCSEYIFWAQYVHELSTVASSISIAMRKHHPKDAQNNDITKDILLNPHSMKQLMNKDLAYKSLVPVRGSPPYWEKTMRDLFAMLRQLGKLVCIS